MQHLSLGEPVDIRWKQRFNNYIKALQTVRRAVALARERELTELEAQGLIQGFEFTHELVWNLLKDYLESKGFTEMIGSRDAVRTAFKYGILVEGDIWMDMIKSRNLTSHTYDSAVAAALTEKILKQYYDEFEYLAQKMTVFYDQA